jgi:hypothetical protein
MPENKNHMAVSTDSFWAKEHLSRHTRMDGLTGQFHRDRRKATCVEDAIVGPELNSAEG